MDYIKTYTSIARQGLLKMPAVTPGMEFGISKCKTVHIEDGKFNPPLTQETLYQEEIEQLLENELY